MSVRAEDDNHTRDDASKGHYFQNWMKTTTTSPSQLLEVSTIGEIQSIVINEECYPSPVRPTGSILSHTDIHANDGGTTLLMNRLNKIHGIDTYTYKKKTDSGVIRTEQVTCIKVDPCVTLREVQLYAQKHGVSISLSSL